MLSHELGDDGRLIRAQILGISGGSAHIGFWDF